MEDTRRQNRLSMPNTGRQNRVSMTDTRRHSRLSMFDNPMFDTQRASMYENPQPDSRRASLYENRRASTGAIIGEQNGPRRDFALTRQDSISLGLLDSPSNVDESKKEPVSKEAAPEKNAPASKIPLIILMVAVSLATFLVALDRTIVATAIPKITDEFSSSADAGWYASAYLLTWCAFQPTCLFELGSLICGVAQTSATFIVGRALAGVGCAGVFAGAIVIISLNVELRLRPVFISLLGAIFGIGTVVGPLVGGGLTTNASWRWCFYMNLPVGAVTFISLVLFDKSRKPAAQEPFFKKVLKMDLLGNFLIITTIVMLLLALQWGGTTYAWNSAIVIGLFVGSGVEGAVFLAWQWYRGPKALLPFSILFQRTVISAFGMTTFLMGGIMVHAYYFPYWFQAIRGETAFESGLHYIPYAASLFIFAMIAGALVTKTGHYMPPTLLGTAMFAIGSGLMITLQIDTSTARWVGFQIFAGAGIGIASQQAIVAAQAVLPPEAMAIGSSLMIFGQSLAGAIFVSVGNTILRNQLSSSLTEANIPNVDVAAVLAAGATDVRKMIPLEHLHTFLSLYNDAITKVFILVIPLSVLSFLSSLPMEWKSVKAKKPADDKKTPGGEV